MDIGHFSISYVTHYRDFCYKSLSEIRGDPSQQVSLYFPKTILQFGHLCLTFWRLSTQKGTQKQGQSMVKQRIRLRLQAIMLGLVLVLVVISIWQLGHTSRAGLGPSSGI